MTFRPLTPRLLIAWLTVAICCSTLLLASIGYRVIVNWERSATLLADQRANEAADLLTTAIIRDMRGVQTSVLPSILNSPADAMHHVATAFARFPYPEAFFGWQGEPSPDSLTFYSRSDRYPGWMPPHPSDSRFPVLIGHEPGTAVRLIERITRETGAGHRLSVFDMEIGDEPYQVVAAAAYADQYYDRPRGIFGFIVNIGWVKHQYFGELTTQVARIASVGSGMSLAVLDDRGVLLTGTRNAIGSAPTGRRVFPAMFFNPAEAAADLLGNFKPAYWTAEAVLAQDTTLTSAKQGARRTLAVAAAATLALAFGLVLTVRAVRASGRLAEMRAEFVSAVTHELKTPVAGLRLIGEALASGRVTTLAATREYAEMAVLETRRLGRLIDNLLAYSRVTDLANVYSFELVSIDAVVDDVIAEFATALRTGRFEVHNDTPLDLPFVRADQTALELLLSNLVDNAIRYSSQQHWLRISAHAEGTAVVVAVQDRGVGIDPGQLPHVTERFFRGRRSGSSGSGLGLAIADRIATDHGGSLTILSEPGTGTTVSVRLIAEEAKTAASSHRAVSA